MEQFKKRDREVKKVFLITLFLNLFVAAIKLIAGHYFHLISLSSSGVESLFDGSANILALVTMYYASMPADDDHHYGHYKYETIGSLILAFMILFSAVQIGSELKESLFLKDRNVQTSIIPIITICISMMISLFVSKYEKKKGEQLGSQLLLADADHTYGDFLISFAVLVSIIFTFFKIYIVDFIVGIIICIYLFYLGVKIIRNNLPHLLDASPEFEADIVKKLLKLSKVKDIHKFRARGNSHLVHVDFHMLLENEISLKEAHDISHLGEDIVRRELSSNFNHVDVTIHVEPFEENHQD